jgi:hypothetical protein
VLFAFSIEGRFGDFLERVPNTLKLALPEIASVSFGPIPGLAEDIEQDFSSRTISRTDSSSSTRRSSLSTTRYFFRNSPQNHDL